jgi:two-component system phosphate regulon sensor histidine kinase PhoR
LVRDGLDEQQQTTERHTLRLESDLAELTGRWDARRLTRVLTNLVDNAIKYTPDGGEIVVRVLLERADAGDLAVLDVQDQGIGIPSGELERIFDRFQRASNAHGRIGGTGIGLASVRHIVESHGGTIVVHSQEDVGSSFQVRLPIGREEGE